MRESVRLEQRKKRLGKSPMLYFLKRTFPEPLDRIQDRLRSAGTWKGELEHVKRDGSRVLVSTHWVLSADNPDGPPRVIETHTDITARFQIQEELEAANEQLKRMAAELERSNEELEEFARIASHDLGAPITSTRWLVDLLSSRHAAKLDPSGRECLKQVSQALERMAGLVDAVLAHAQVGKGPIGSSVTTQGETALAIALDNLRRDIESSGSDDQSRCSSRLLIEPQALSQLFQNLLLNAIKYRKPDTRPIVKISIGREGSMWLLGVQDDGIGIQSEWFERIFQPMQRVSWRNDSGKWNWPGDVQKDCHSRRRENLGRIAGGFRFHFLLYASWTSGVATGRASRSSGRRYFRASTA